MLQLYRERLTLLLIALLPFHALFVTLVTKLVAGPGHAPLTAIVLWKEVMLAVILILAFLELIAHSPKLIARIDFIDSLILGLLIIAVGLFLGGKPASPGAFLIGLKYDFTALIAFMVLRRVTWSAGFLGSAYKILLIIGVIVSAYGLLAVTVPATFFTALGYSDLHSLYVPGGPLAAFQQIGGTAIRRLQSTMSGPNQLGLWLLLPLSIALLRRRPAEGLIILVALFATLSRSAVLATFVIITPILWKTVSRKNFVRLTCGVAVLAVLFAVVGGPAVPTLITRSASTRDHIARPFMALKVILAHPLGAGLSAAGPASNRVSDACVFLEEGSDPSWAADRPELCVFVGGVQKQPTERMCSCPFLPENWYLQMGVEMGVLGFLLFVTLMIVVLKRLAISDQRSAISGVFLAFLGVSIAAFFLHAWEDSAVAYTLWVLAAAQIPIKRS